MHGRMLPVRFMIVIATPLVVLCASQSIPWEARFELSRRGLPPCDADRDAFVSSSSLYASVMFKSCCGSVDER